MPTLKVILTINQMSNCQSQLFSLRFCYSREVRKLPPFYPQTRDLTRCCKHSSEMLVHVDSIASHRRCRFVGSVMQLSCFTTSQGAFSNWDLGTMGTSWYSKVLVMFKKPVWDLKLSLTFFPSKRDNRANSPREVPLTGYFLFLG